MNTKIHITENLDLTYSNVKLSFLKTKLKINRFGF